MEHKNAKQCQVIPHYWNSIFLVVIFADSTLNIHICTHMYYTYIYIYYAYVHIYVYIMPHILYGIDRTLFNINLFVLSYCYNYYIINSTDNIINGTILGISFSICSWLVHSLIYSQIFLIYLLILTVYSLDLCLGGFGIFSVYNEVSYK